MVKIIIKKTIFAFILIICIVSVSAQISEIEEKLQKQDKAKVIVILKPEEKKLFSLFGKEKNIQDKVLDSLNLKEKKILGLFRVKPDFLPRRKYSTVPAFSGEITTSGLKKLKANPNVKGIYLNKKVHTMLQQSAPLINADDVSNKEVNGIPITGAGQTICVVDTGIDYKHSSIGSSQCTHSDWIVEGTIQTHNEYHSYSALEDTVYTITKPGFSNIAVHFSKIDVSKDEAYVFIEDQHGAKVQAFSGSYNDEWTYSVPGNTIKIHIVDYWGSSGYGFNIDKVVNGITRIDWFNCGDFLNGYDAANFDIDPMDDDGHGTHVSGIITSDHPTYKGIAPDAKIVAFKALNNEGWGYDDAIIGSIDGCIRMADLYNISVISLSLGGATLYSSSCDGSSSYTSFINKAADNNILVVAASGNNGDSSKIVEPACVNKATPVGSTGDGSGGTTADQISSSSNRWSQPMIFAPGDLIYSTQRGGGFVGMAGTSMSAPHVSGVAALIYQYAELKGIEITPQEIENILIETGKQIDGNYKRVDALAAIKYFEKISKNISLKKGWNLLSIPLNLTNNTLTEAFKSIEGNYSHLFVYGDKKWYSYYSSEVPTNKSVEPKIGFWINMTNDDILELEGIEWNYQISPKKGWNLVGYPHLEEKNISEFFNNVTVYTYNNSDSKWYSYDSEKPSQINTLNKFTPGFGYWIKIK